MADPEDEPIDEQQPDQAALAVVARHALHDEELIAAFAGGDLETGEESDRARALTERCSACRDLYQDVQLIDNLIRAADTAAEYGARVSAPRDFRLTVDDARRLGGPVPVVGVPAGGIRERLRTALAGVARPLGASMATLGVVGLLFGSMAFGSAGMPGSEAIDGAAPTGVPANAEQGSGGVPGATRGSTTSLSSGSTDGPARSAAGGQGTASTPLPASSSPGDLSAPIASSSTMLQAGSAALLLIGIALLVIGLRGRGRRRE